MTRIAKDITELIGGTPLVRIISEGEGAEIVAKLEMFNPLSSVKDRIALAMIEDAESRGLIAPGDVLIEPTSGNTGVGLAFVSAVRGYRLILTMPESMSMERRKLLRSLGARVVLTRAFDGMEGAVAKAEELRDAIPGSHILQQFSNESNPCIHERTTAQEIWDDTGGDLDVFVSTVGTGGTLTGVARVLKERAPHVHVVAVEPFSSSVLSGGRARPHKIQGIGAGFIPDVLDTGLIDEIVRVEDDAAGDAAREVARTQGLLVGISSGAALWAAREIARRPEYEGKRIVAVFPDTGERYLSTWLYEDLGEVEWGEEVEAAIAKASAEKKPASSATDLARYYFRNGYSCSEATVRALNEFYELGLPEDAHRIATGFGAGLGEAGCACGCVTGCVMALSLLAGREKVHESNRLVFLATKELHDRFRKKNKALCCRLLTKDVEWSSAEHKILCETYVTDAASITEEIIGENLREQLSSRMRRQAG
jgi:cysteine synthase A